MKHIVFRLVGTAYTQRCYQSATGITEVILQKFACGAGVYIGLYMAVTDMDNRDRSLEAAFKGRAELRPVSAIIYNVIGRTLDFSSKETSPFSSS